MPIKYTIDKENKLICETWSEFVTIEEFIQLKKQEFSDPEFNPSYNVLTDLTVTKLSFDENLISEIVKYMQSNPAEIKNRKSAIVADKPQLVAGGFVFSDTSENLPINIKLFTTKEAALSWLKVKINL